MTVLLERPVVEVLVVEDGDDQRFLMQRYFELAGCSVTATSTAEQAINLMGEFAPDVAVIDLILPGMNGWELADRIREVWPDCVIVIASVLDMDLFPASDARFTKPVSRANVSEILENFVPGWAA